MFVKSRLFLEAAIAIALALSSLFAVSTNDNLKASLSTAVDAGADLAAGAKAALTTTISNLEAGLQANIQGGATASAEGDTSLGGDARTESQWSIDLNLGGGDETSAKSETSARSSVKADFDEALQAMFNAFGFNFQSLFGFSFGS